MSKKCIYCKKSRDDHQSKTLACPIGLKHRTLGHTQFHAKNQFTDKTGETGVANTPIFRRFLSLEDEISLPGMALISGQVFDYENLDSLVIYQEDLCETLWNQRRYQGVLDVRILQHLCLVTRMAEISYGKGSMAAALCASHDLHEAYFPDIPRPFKKILPGYEALEAKCEAHVHRSIGLDWPLGEKLKQIVRGIDNRAPLIEAVLCRHPLKRRFEAHHGGPINADEFDLGVDVFFLSREECWQTVISAIGSVGGSILKMTEPSSPRRFLTRQLN